MRCARGGGKSFSFPARFMHVTESSALVHRKQEHIRPSPFHAAAVISHPLSKLVQLSNSQALPLPTAGSHRFVRVACNY
jgi:hypothetical protein